LVGRRLDRTSALFLLLSLLTWVPVEVAGRYILVWESLLGRLLSSTRVLPIQPISGSDLLATLLSPPVAMRFLVAVGAKRLTIDRLCSFSVVGETA
jgi:hypothetical protein